MKQHFLSVKDSRVKPGKDRILLALLLLPLLFTSCLADYLNDKFNFHVPCYLIYDTAFGTTPAKKTFTDSYTLTAADLPTLSSGNSYTTFDGWYLDSAFTKKATAGTVIKDNTTLHAHWQDYSTRQYTIYYSSERGEYIYPVTVTWGTYLIYHLPTPYYYSNDYYFDGWYLDPGCTIKPDEWMKVESDLTLYAKWNEVTSPEYYYNLYYYDEGGNIFTTISVLSGEYLDADYFNGNRVSYYVQQGYDFNGWFTDPYNFTNDAIYQYIYQDYYLYASVTPRTDTPYTVEFYLMDTENNSYVFERQDQYTLYTQGQTDSYIAFYDYRDNPLDAMYQLIFSSDTTDTFGPTCGTVSGDGSSVFRLYYYGQNIYPNQFEQMEAALPNINEGYNIQFKPDAANPLSLEEIKQIIENAIINSGYYYYKRFDLGLGSTGLTEIPAYIFEGKDYIGRIYLPESCEKIGAGAFYGCYYLDWVTFPSSSDKKWYYIDDTNTEIELDTSDNFANSEFLKNNLYEIYLR